METTFLSGKSVIFQYAILSTKICQIIKRIEKQKPVDNKSYKVLERGANLLTQIVEGSILIERKGQMEGLSPSQEGLPAFGYALSALENLNKVPPKEITQLFLDLRNETKALSEKKPIKKDNLTRIKKFFIFLSDLISEEIQKDKYQFHKKPKTILDRHSSLASV